MGIIHHHAVVLMVHDEELAAKVKSRCEEIGICHYQFPPQVNCTITTFIPPDGSKEYWRASDEGDVLRSHLLEWAKKNKRIEVIEMDWGDLGMHFTVNGFSMGQSSSC